MMHTHGAHWRPIARARLTMPQPGDLPGFRDGETLAAVRTAPDPRTAVHRTIAPPPATIPTPVVKQSAAPSRRPSWPTTIALALICTCLGGALAAYTALPTQDPTRVAVRAVSQ
jgi:hypothetical protein